MQPIKRVTLVSFLLLLFVFVISSFVGGKLSELIGQRLQVASPAILTSTSFFDDYDNLNYVEQSSFSGVAWDGQGILTYITGNSEEIDPTSILGNSLRALWHFNSNSQNVINGEVGTLVGDTNCTAAGRFAQACIFDGSGDAINMGTNMMLNLPNNFSIAMWFKTTADNITMLSRTISPSQLQLSVYGGKIAFKTGAGGWVSGGPVVNNNQWHQVVATVSSLGEARIYVDGVLAIVSTGHSVNAPGTVLNIGSAGSGTESFNGLIDETAIWGRVLLPTEVTQLAQAIGGGSPVFGSFQSITLNSGEIAQLTANWQEVTLGATTLSFSTNNGSTWCPINNGQTLASSACFGGTTLKYKAMINAPGNLQNVTLTWSAQIQPPVITNNYFVAPTGNDANPGTLALPWKTLTKAGAQARAGDTVYIRAGTYNQTLTPASSGTASAKITFKAYPGDECKGVLGGRKTDCRVTIKKIYPSSYLTIQGVAVSGSGDDAVEFDGNEVYVTMENTSLHGNGLSGFRTRGAHNLLLRNNHIYENQKDGIDGGCTDCVIEYNYLNEMFASQQHPDCMDLSNLNRAIIRYNTVSDCSQLIYIHNYWGPSNDIQIYGNVMYNDRYWSVNGGETQGVHIDGSFGGGTISNVNIHSNTVGWTGYESLQIYGNISNVNVRNNLLYSGGSYINSNNNLSGQNTQALFMNYQGQGSANFDFSLKSGSPAINQGALGSIPTPDQFVDIAGTVRPQVGIYDIGAYEFASTTPPAGGGSPGSPNGSQPCSTSVTTKRGGLPQTSAPLAPCGVQ